MKARVVAGSIVASAAVLTIGWAVGQPPAIPAASAVKLTDGTYSGTSVQTEFGDVQVEITVAGGKISDVKPLQLTNAEQRSVDISNEAAPILRSEVLAAQSAKVATVSGATYTSQGYLGSLQSAIDKASA